MRHHDGDAAGATHLQEQRPPLSIDLRPPGTMFCRKLAEWVDKRGFLQVPPGGGVYWPKEEVQSPSRRREPRSAETAKQRRIAYVEGLAGEHVRHSVGLTQEGAGPRQPRRLEHSPTRTHALPNRAPSLGCFHVVTRAKSSRFQAAVFASYSVSNALGPHWIAEMDL